MASLGVGLRASATMPSASCGQWQRMEVRIEYAGKCDELALLDAAQTCNVSGKWSIVLESCSVALWRRARMEGQRACLQQPGGYAFDPPRAEDDGLAKRLDAWDGAPAHGHMQTVKALQGCGGAHQVLDRDVLSG